jgi:hypothetical protein|tara:strand:+ start:2899 stop:3141 length:243 start_codon:yes stop_codon:yes gene_type:complete
LKGNLYLIRRNFESFVGPLSYKEFNEAYQRMELGLQDEVAGHCGSWVVLENFKDLKKNYPEIAEVVSPHLLQRAISLKGK